jgi:hypothetical protein
LQWGPGGGRPCPNGAVFGEAFAQRSNLVPDCRFLVGDPALPDAAREIVLADHRPRRLEQRQQHLEDAAAGPYRPTVNQDFETNFTTAKRGRRGQLRAMIKIDIFKENHRFAD